MDLIQAFGVDHILFCISNAFVIPVHLIFIHFSLFNCSEVLKISRRFVYPLFFHSSYFEDVISFKPFNSTGAFSLLNRFNGVSFEWALTHRSFPRILPGSSDSPGAILKNSFRNFDVRMNYHQSYVFLQDLSNSFHRWLNFYILLYSGASIIIGAVSRRHSQVRRPKKSFF